MTEWNESVYEELISDTRFVNWVHGKDFSKADYWNSWTTDHPQYTKEFTEAVKMMKYLNFKHQTGNSEDIRYQWMRTEEQINRKNPTFGVRYLLSVSTKIAAVLLLPLLLLSAWLFYSHHQISEQYASLVASQGNQNVQVVAPIGARLTINLPDGSVAWLNSGSEISYPAIFNTNERRVALKGEAYFKVQKSTIPFFVSSIGPEIKVYGTEFNVNSYEDEDIETVALTEGKISLLLNGREEFIEPGQVSTFDRKKKSVTIENTDVNNYSTWREGKYIFRDAPLSTILRILQRQHKVSISLLDPELGDYRYNMTINNESLEQILNLLSISAPIKYNIKHYDLNDDGSHEPDNIEISGDPTRKVKTKI